MVGPSTIRKLEKPLNHKYLLKFESPRNRGFFLIIINMKKKYKIVEIFTPWWDWEHPEERDVGYFRTYIGAWLAMKIEMFRWEPISRTMFNWKIEKITTGEK